MTPKEIAKQVNALLKNPAELKRLKINASRMSAELSWENEFAPVLTKIYKNNG